MGWSRLLTLCVGLLIFSFVNAAQSSNLRRQSPVLGAQLQNGRGKGQPGKGNPPKNGNPGKGGNPPPKGGGQPPEFEVTPPGKGELANLIPIRPPECNKPTNRQCWGRYDIKTDYYAQHPKTGVVRTYNFVLTQTTHAPDGVPRFMQLVNGQYPGPTIEANWGDEVVVIVKNQIPNNGSAIHFHGIRQLHTFEEDGVPGVTQCPIPPGETMIYKWTAEQYGSSWYHSHWSLQAWQGVLGPIVIHGPASANYDEDLGPLVIQDWSHSTVDELWDQAQSRGPPLMDNGLINGTNTFNGTSGRRFERTFEKGKKYLIRLVNVAIDTHFRFSIDNHTLTVIATDFVAIEPYTVQFLSIGIAQRYDIIVEAKDPLSVGKYWLRAVPQLSCSPSSNPDDIKGIIRYGASSGDPATTAYTMPDDCLNEDISRQHPVVAKTVGSATALVDERLTLQRPGGVFRWFLNSTSLKVDWSQPTILSLWKDQPYTNQSGVVEINGGDNDWVYFVIQTAIGLPHPIHLHGHDFYVIAQGSGPFGPDIPLNLNNPARRDVQMLPPSGFLAIAFKTDNPGSWLLHCHIGWHQSEGLAMQFVERKSEIKKYISGVELVPQCDQWKRYFQVNPNQFDSGVRRSVSIDTPINLIGRKF